MRDVNLELHEDHKRIQCLLRKLTWEIDKTRWSELVALVAREIEAHMSAEETAVYAHLLKVRTEGVVAKHYQQEHDEIRKCVRRLEKALPDTNTAIENFAELSYMFTEHVTEEEEALFPLLEDTFDDEKMDEMFRAYCDEKSRIVAEWHSTSKPPAAPLAKPWSPLRGIG